MSDPLIIIKTDKAKRERKRDYQINFAEEVFNSAYDDLVKKVQYLSDVCISQLGDYYLEQRKADVIRANLFTIQSYLEPLISLSLLLEQYANLKNQIE